MSATRRRILQKLATEGEQRFTQILQELTVSKQDMAYHLRKLQEAGWVEKKGKHYQLTKWGIIVFTHILDQENAMKLIPKDTTNPVLKQFMEEYGF